MKPGWHKVVIWGSSYNGIFFITEHSHPFVYSKGFFLDHRGLQAEEKGTFYHVSRQLPIVPVGKDVVAQFILAQIDQDTQHLRKLLNP